MTSPRKAFTLIELLVVAALMVVMLGLLVTNTRPSASAIRSGQDFASVLLAAQSRALGRPEGAAVILENDGTVFYEADMLPPIKLPVIGGNVTFHADLATSYKLRFFRSVGGGFAAISPWLGLQSSVPVRRELAGQTAANTILEPPGDDIEALVMRSPRVGSTPIQVRRGTKMFLEHSGVGDLPLVPDVDSDHGYYAFDGPHQITVVFEHTGRVAEVIKLGALGSPEPLSPTEIIYFLFGEAGESTPLLSERSVWVAVNPQSGRINVASNVPSTDIVVARSKARQAIAFGK